MRKQTIIKKKDVLITAKSRKVSQNLYVFTTDIYIMKLYNKRQMKLSIVNTTQIYPVLEN